MMKFIFEDNRNMTLSNLLLNCYNHNNILFSDNGNSDLFNILNKVYNIEDEFIIFLDFNCRNKLYNVFLDLKSMIKRELDNPENVYIIPIPCIEYIVLDMLNTYKYVSDNNLYNILDFNKDVIKKYGISFEKGLKGFLKSLGSDFLNYNIVDSSKFYPLGRFYLDIESTPSLKAERFYTKLPIFDTLVEVNDEYINILKQFDIKYEFTDYNNINNKVKSLFEYMEKQLNRQSHYELSIYCS